MVLYYIKMYLYDDLYSIFMYLDTNIPVQTYTKRAVEITEVKSRVSKEDHRRYVSIYLHVSSCNNWETSAGCPFPPWRTEYGVWNSLKPQDGNGRSIRLLAARKTRPPSIISHPTLAVCFLPSEVTVAHHVWLVWDTHAHIVCNLVVVQ